LFVIAIETVRPTKAYIESRLEATLNGSCVDLRDRIIESFIGVINDLMTSRSLCQPRHRCRIRNTFVYCSADVASPPSTSSDVPSSDNLTVDFVLETELKPTFRPATVSEQQDLVHSLEDVDGELFTMVRDGELTWSTHDSHIVAVSLDSDLVQFDMDNCSTGQVLNSRNADVPTCRELSLYYLLTYLLTYLLYHRRQQSLPPLCLSFIYSVSEQDYYKSNPPIH